MYIKLGPYPDQILWLGGAARHCAKSGVGYIVKIARHKPPNWAVPSECQKI